MGWNINTIYNFLNYMVRKERGAFISPEEASTALDSAQMELFEGFFKIYGVNQEVHDSLSPFKVRLQFTSASNGIVTQPSDYQHLLGGVFTVSGSTICPLRFISEDELPDALTNQLRPVNTSSPIALDTPNGFQIYPQVTQTGFYTYMRRPAVPILGYTQTGRTLVYNPTQYNAITQPTGSQQIEFADAYINNIMARALKFFGINMDEQGIIAFAQSQTQQTV